MAMLVSGSVISLLHRKMIKASNGCKQTGEPSHGSQGTILHIELELSDEQCSRAPGWLFGIGDYTTQLYGDYNKPI